MIHQFLSNFKILKALRGISGREYDHNELVVLIKTLSRKYLNITLNNKEASNLINDLIDGNGLKRFYRSKLSVLSTRYVFDPIKFNNLSKKVSTANIFLDLEGTLIDDIKNCKYLEENCKTISNFIHTYSADTIKVHIFTWAFLQRSEITKDANYTVLKNIEQKIGHIISSYVVKEDSLLHHASVQGIERIDLPQYEIAVYDSGFTKEHSFIEMFKEASFTETHILIDDCISEPKAINFIKDNLYTTDFCSPNIIFLNPQNL